MEAVMEIPRVKPKLRGVSHQIAAIIALGTTVGLVAWAHGFRGRLAAAIYGLALTTMYTVSAAYHRPTWQPAARQRMRRLDHATIYLLIAATYTPIALLLPGSAGRHMLIVSWVSAFLGILQAIFWVDAPKAIAAVLYVAFGWASVAFMPDLAARAGAFPVVMLAVGGVIYSLGAIVYAMKRPDPFPRMFGYHEIFHALVIVASICHFACEVHVIRLMT